MLDFLINSFGRSGTFWSIILAVDLLTAAWSYRRSQKRPLSQPGNPDVSLGPEILPCAITPFIACLIAVEVVPEKPAAFLWLFVASIIGVPLVMLMTFVVLNFVLAKGRGEICVALSRPVQHPSEVKAHEVARLARPCGANSVSQFCEGFIQQVKEIKEADVKWELPQEYLELLFLAGLSDQLSEWTTAICNQYTIAGQGSGPELNMEQLMEMAVREAETPELAQTVAPGSMPRVWRKTCALVATCGAPSIVLGSIIHIWFLA